MKLSEEYIGFQVSLEKGIPIEEWPLYKKALWWEAKGNWENSHAIAQDLNTPIGAWIHAYLHRKEGDKFNAAYWYRQANKPYPKISLESEFELMLTELL